MNILKKLLIIGLVALLVVGCSSGGEAPAGVAESSATPQPSNTPTPRPTDTPEVESPDPLSLIEDAEKNMLELVSYSSIITMTTYLYDEGSLDEAYGSSLNCQVSQEANTVFCEVDAPWLESLGYVRFSEFVRIGERVWWTFEGLEEWSEANLEFLEMFSVVSKDIYFPPLADSIISATITGEAVVNGEPVYIVEFELDWESYIFALQGEDAAGLDVWQTTGTYWIGQGDLLIYKKEIHYSDEELELYEQSMIEETNFGKFNEHFELPSLPNPEEFPNPEALRLIRESGYAFPWLESFTVEHSSIINFGPTFSVEEKCQINRTEWSMYCQRETFIGSGEQATLIDNSEKVLLDQKIWVRRVGYEWQLVDFNSVENFGFGMMELANLSWVHSKITSANIVEESMLDDIPVYIVEFELDAEDYIEDYMMDMDSRFSTVPVSEDEMSVGVTIWIGMEDNLTYKAEVTITYEIEGEVFETTIHKSYSGFNEPVTIPNPEAE